jgi:hypothetical protein
MNSPISMKILSRRLILISAAILINANTALAADRVSDAQMQARDLLSGTGGGTKTIDRSLAMSADHHQRSYADPQKQARQIILGKPSFDGGVQSRTNVPVPVSARWKSRVHTDPQESARRVILGTEEGSGSESAGMRLSGIQKGKN